jgi:hypothetical protein
MAKPKHETETNTDPAGLGSTTQTVVIETERGPIEAKRGDRVLVVKMASITQHETGESWPHDYAASICDLHYRLPPLGLEAGATLVSAGLWADHVEAKSPGLTKLTESGEITVHGSAAAAFANLSINELRKVIAVTRHGLVLREWEQLEQASDRPRKVVLEALRERLRLYRDHAPLDYYTLPQRVGTAA